ncbi:DUF1971 domain-containing protein [Parasphingorhabdus sp.]|uniref:DUF1971 domain-containing protein n=1 Tax=Parasphingorhabdus sp. TaxID=2709688 RepID=UPI003A9084D7
MPIAPYSASPIFDENSLPNALRNEHTTKDGTWGLLRVLEGEVRLVFLNPSSERLVTVADPAPIPPQSPHFVKLAGPMKMQVEFYREHPLGADIIDG